MDVLKCRHEVECPNCHFIIRHDIVGGNWRLTCPGCSREWRIHYSHRWLYSSTTTAIAFLLAYLSKAEGPFFLTAFLFYWWMIYVATAHYVLVSLLPKKLEPLQGYIQTLGINSDTDR